MDSPYNAHHQTARQQSKSLKGLEGKSLNENNLKKVVDTTSYLVKMAAHFERKAERLKNESLASRRNVL